jgi:CHAT domain-containing protein
LADLVIAPIAPLLSKDRVIVAADGALQYVPFAALPLRSQDGTSAPLIASREVVGIPSLSAAVGHRAGASRTAPSKSVAIFADPVFDGRDPRMPAQYLATAESAEPPILAQREATRGGTALARLPLSAREAQVIAGLVPESERFVAVGFDASRDAVLRTNLEDYRIVHFATHGLIDPRYPDLSSLALSQFDSTGTRTNGFLRLPDIYGLRLNADLVVLSACETALGRDIRGEGLLGLTQGFLYAGAKSLVASLWPVADRATAELMARFYDNALKQGMRPAEALRRAQLSIAAEPRWRDPYYWSAFVLLGEWR